MKSDQLVVLIVYLALLPIVFFVNQLALRTVNEVHFDATGKEVGAERGLPQYPEFRTNSSFLKPLTIHGVRHSHFDPYWFRNISESSLGFRDYLEIYMNHTKLVEQGLAEHYSMTMSDVFFLMMNDTKPRNKTMLGFMKKLFSSYKWELVNCGSTMPDQALTSYEDLINNFEFGREFCKQEFGILPRIGWAIDTFGQSAYMSRLYAEMGYEYVVNTRVNSYNKTRMKRE